MPKLLQRQRLYTWNFTNPESFFRDIVEKLRSSFLLDIIPYHSDAALIKPALVT